MRTAKLIRAVNWRHAVGELVLIVAGILIALAISDWNDRRVQRAEELALLAEVRSALVLDMATLEGNLELVTESADRIKHLIGLLEQKPAYDPRMDQLFGAAYGIRAANLNTTAFETLKSVGLQHISNPELRLRLVRIYDHFYERLITENGIEFTVTFDLMRPYYLQHFRNLKFSTSATPMNYEMVVNDPWYRNVIEYRLAILKANQLDSHPEVIADIRAVLKLLDAELGPASGP